MNTDNTMSFLMIMLVISVVVLLIILGIVSIIRNQKLNKIVNLLNDKKFDEFDKMMESKLVKFIFNPFNLDYMKLNSYLLRKDKKKVDEIFEKFDQVRLSKAQKDDLDLKAFDYYLSIEHRQKCKKYLDRINTSETNKMKKTVNRLYNIYIEKGSKYLNELIEETEQMDVKYRGANEFLISAIYANLGNKAKEKEYQDLAEKHFTFKDGY